MAGRKPKPTNLKILQGNPGKRPLNLNEPQPEAGIPDTPDFLDKVAREEWDRITPQLELLGVITLVDRSALAAYCQCYSRWQKAEQIIKKKGLTMFGKEGDKKRPEVAIAHESMQLMKAFASEFGLTPSSRSRLSTTPKNPNAKTKAEKFFGG